MAGNQQIRFFPDVGDSVVAMTTPGQAFPLLQETEAPRS